MLRCVISSIALSVVTCGELHPSAPETAAAETMAQRAFTAAQEGGYELGGANAAILRGRVAEALGDYDGALGHARKALSIRERVLGTEHPDTSMETAKQLPLPIGHNGGCYNAAGGCRCEPYTSRAFWLQDSLFDDGNMHWITGGPRLTRSLP